ncbi:hypothetical protein Peur_038936 [Populus x canadensis]
MALSICCVCYERSLSVDTTSNAAIAVAVDPPATSAVPLISSTPALSAAASSTDHTNYLSLRESFLRAIHHYPDKYNCSSDYRSAGQDAIAKANPIVKAEKLDKI